MTDEVRAARFGDLDAATAYRLWALREAVFVVEQRCAYQELDGRDHEPATLHLWVETGGEPVAYLRLLDDGDHWRIGRVLTAPAHRGRGLAAALVQEALQRCDDVAVRLDAQSHLEHWYAALGFVRCGEEFVEDGIPHVPMSRADGHASTAV